MADPTKQELTAIWEGVRSDLRDALPAATFESWLAPLRALGVRGDRLYVTGPERIRDWFERRYEPLAAAALRSRVPAITGIVFSQEGAEREGDADRENGGTLDPSLDFDSFVIGEGNRFAHAAALAVAELPGEAYNPLFLHGEPGLGKTHLLASIANYLRRRRPDMEVVYTTAERFTSEFVSSVRGGGPESFKRRYRNVGALLIDDVQFLEDKPRTEDEFFHTFNELYAAGAQIVLSSDRPPTAMERLTERLRDRFDWGLTVEVRRPDAATRIALLRRLATANAIPIPDASTLERIAAAAPENLRRLEGALTRVAALGSLLGEPASEEVVERALADLAVQPEADDDPSAEITRIQAATCEVLGVSEAELRSDRRAPNLVRARQLAMYVARNSTEASLAEIARAHNRDHSTVVHSLRTIQRRLEPGSDVHRALEAIHQRLGITPEIA